ncbi:hypothetical protein C2S52_009021 [Perilla frutescens var. hirtella]|nr:hypothetical protein C2S52_009021 [Perilla frutescens var. hirtella]
MKNSKKKSVSSSSKQVVVVEEEEEEEPVSPTGRLMHSPKFNISIILIMGYYTKIDPNLYKKCMHQTLLKHPRFTSIPMMKNGKFRWKRTTVDIEKHSFVPDVNPNMESPDGFVAEFASNLSRIPMDMTKPLWEFYILNVKTSDAESVVVARLHHSLGDGVSLIALTHACARKIDDPDSLPVFPLSKKEKKKGGDRGLLMTFFALLWTLILIVSYTLIDIPVFIATMLFVRDVQTPIKVERGRVPSQNRFVHRIVSLADVKLVKTAMNVSINDVILGVTEAGLSRYLTTIYENKKEKGKKSTGGSLPRNLGIRSTVVFNLRPTPTIEDLVEMMEKEKLNGMWGNLIGIVILPLKIVVQDDPLTYIRRAKSTMDRKKLSLVHKCAFVVMKLAMSLFGIEVASRMVTAVFRNTTLTFSNVMGPKEEVNLFGHHLSYIAPSVYGFPQSMVVHYQSYGDKLVISIGADGKLIPNPHQLCDDFIRSLQNIKEAVIERGLVDVASQFC